ncbi:MAG: lytic murein transglycosylase B [Gammaproteobacteria bacterium]|nr:lytic murein transglycosylase B [Gammaproteobacteria bacterium]|tara:strand:- start:476 stop:1495 length:1020 start_codon:yes stop_codon:yes gene_type:complete
MKTFNLKIISTILFLNTPVYSADTIPINLEQDNVIEFIDEMIRDHKFDRAYLNEILSKAKIKKSIIKHISAPAERTLSWKDYRKIFITNERVNIGVNFWRENKKMLERIERETGVSIEILVGIIGVETYFGRITGKDRVIDALATLAFQYPPRSNFFKKELKHFFILTREEELDPLIPMGSYAGAMGRPQFMPSSFRAYAVDSSGNGKRDIWNDWADVSGSIANYFLAHKWRSNEEVAVRASLSKNWKGKIPRPNNILKISNTLKSLENEGVQFTTDLPKNNRGELLTFKGKNGLEHWVGFHNFFVITKYNRNVMYALAVHQLGQQISKNINLKSNDEL